MPVHDLTQMARKWIEAFNRHDIEAILALYHEEAVHHTPKSDKPIVGKDALRQWWQDAFKRYPSLLYRLDGAVQEGNSIFIEYERYVDSERPLRVAEKFEVDADGKICRSCVYHG